MAARELGLLGVPGLELIPDAVEQLHVALLGPLLERRDEGPRHGAGGLGSDCRVGTGRRVSGDCVEWCDVA